MIESLQKFLTKLNNAKDDLFTFLLYDTAEPTNNTAEPTNNTAEPTNNTAEPTNNTAEPTNNTAEPTNNTAEPTNNTAECALRESVIHRKIRGCVRNQKGCKMFGNLVSCIMTWKMGIVIF